MVLGLDNRGKPWVACGSGLPLVKGGATAPATPGTGRPGGGGVAVGGAPAWQRSGGEQWRHTGHVRHRRWDRMGRRMAHAWPTPGGRGAGDGVGGAWGGRGGRATVVGGGREGAVAAAPLGGVDEKGRWGKRGGPQEACCDGGGTDASRRRVGGKGAVCAGWRCEVARAAVPSAESGDDALGACPGCTR